jgi:hypothetical protein
MEASGREEEDDVLQARVFAGSVAEGGGGTGAGDQYDHASDREVEGGCGGGESEDHGEGEAMWGFNGGSCLAEGGLGDPWGGQ